MARAPRVFEPEDRARLLQYVRANTVSNLSFVVGLLVLYVTELRSGWVLLLAAVVFTVVLCLMGANRMLRGAHPQRGLYLVAAGTWLACIMPTMVVPFVLPLLTPVVLLPVMLMVPFLERKQLWVMMSVALAVAFACAVLAQLELVDLQDRAPQWLRNTILLVAAPVAVGMVALTAWQNHVGLSAQTDALRRSRARVVAAGDRERRRLERDLHDGTQQQLAAIAVQLGLLRRVVQRDPDRALDIANGISTELDETLSDLRRLAHGLYPPLLEQRGLVEALNAAALRSPIAVKVAGAAVARYSAEVETAVYFCCLEALQNTAKHAGATEARIGLDGTNGLVVTIEDDGKGFDPALVEGGQGLTNMSDRVGATGGSIVIESAPSRGTRVRLIFDTTSANR